MRNRARPKRKSRLGKVYDPAEQEDKLHDLVKDLKDFEEFREKILPAIRQDLMSGMDAEQLREKYSALVQARLITEALTTADSGKAGVIAKDILDRAHGKPTEKKEVTVKYADVSDDELDALLLSEEEDLANMSTTGPKQ